VQKDYSKRNCRGGENQPGHGTRRKPLRIELLHLLHSSMQRSGIGFRGAMQLPYAALPPPNQRKLH